METVTLNAHSNWGDYNSVCITTAEQAKLEELEKQNQDLSFNFLKECNKIETDKNDPAIFYGYIKIDQKLEKGSLILDENDIGVYINYEPKKMKMYSIKNKVKDDELVCTNAPSYTGEDINLIKIIEEKYFYYKVKIHQSDIVKLVSPINSDSKFIVTKKLIVNKQVFSDKQSENAPDPFLDIKYKIGRISEKENSNEKKKIISLNLSNPLWNDNTSFISLEINSTELETTLNKDKLSEMVLEKLEHAKVIQKLIEKIEED